MAEISLSNKQVISGINEVINVFRSLLSQIKGVGSEGNASFRKLHTAVAGLTGVSQNVAQLFMQLNTQLKNTTTSQKSFVTQTRNLKAELKLVNAELQKAKKELKDYENSQKKAGQTGQNVFGNLKQTVLSLLGAFGILQGFQLFRNAVNDAFNLTKSLDSLSFAMKAVINDSKELGQTQVWLQQTTKAFGADIITTTERFIKFRAAAKQAGLTAAETQKIFGTMTKVSGVLGLRTDELKGIFLAIEQMVSKGKITTEELRRQLGERLPGAMDILANSMGKTTAELDKMMKKGEVITKDVLPGFAEEVQKAYGLETVTKVQTLQAATVRLRNAWIQIIEDFRTGSGASKTLMNIFDGLAQNLKFILTSFKALLIIMISYKAVLIALTIRTIALSTAKMFLIGVTKRLSKVTQEQIVIEGISTKVINGSSKAKLASAAASVTLGTVTKALGVQIKALWMIIRNNPLGLLITVLGLAAAAYVFFSKSAYETAKAIQDENKELAQSLKVDADKVQSIESMLTKYEELKKELEETTKGTQEYKDKTKELETVIKQLGEAVPVAKNSVNQYGEALTLNIPLLERWLELEKERIGLEAKKTADEELANYDTALAKTQALNNLREKGALISVEDLGTFQMINGELKMFDKMSGKFTPISDEDRKALILYEQKWLDILATAEKIKKEADNAAFEAGLTAEQRALKKKYEDQITSNKNQQLDYEKAIKETSADAIMEQIKLRKELMDTREAPLIADLDGTGAKALSEQERDTFLKELNAETQEEINGLQERYNYIMGITTKETGAQEKLLKEIRDLTIEINNLENKKKIVELEITANDDTLNLEIREDAIKRLYATNVKESEASRDAEIRDAEIAAKEKQKIVDRERERENSKSKPDASRLFDLLQYEEKIKKEFDQKKEIAEKEHGLRIIELRDNRDQKIENMQDDYDSRSRRRLEDRFAEELRITREASQEIINASNQRSIDAQKAYEESGKNIFDFNKLQNTLAREEAIRTQEKQKLADEEVRIETEKTAAILDLTIIQIEARIKALESEENGSKIHADLIADLKAKVIELKGTLAGLEYPKPGSGADDWKMSFEEILEHAKEFTSSINDLFQSISDRRIENIEAEIKKWEEYYDYQIGLAETNEEADATLERNKEQKKKELEKKKLKEEQKAAKRNKAFKLAEIAIETALSIVRAKAQSLTLPPLVADAYFGAQVAIIAALGALQTATVLAAPIPQYAEGGDIKTDHLGMINEAGSQEYIERGGKILTTEKENAVIPLKAGDIIYPSYEELTKRSMLMAGLYNGVRIEKQNFDEMFFGIENSIIKGFKKAKINNNINLVGFDPEQNAYRNSLTNW